MIKTLLPGPVKGTLALLLIVLNTLWLFPLLLVFAVLKLLPIRPLQSACTVILNRIAWLWIGFNNLLADTLHQTQWQLRGAEQLRADIGIVKSLAVKTCGLMSKNPGNNDLKPGLFYSEQFLKMTPKGGG